MCVFPDADQRVVAAVGNAASRLPRCRRSAGVRRSIRVGFHAGPLIEADGDVFGDTVNTAARMAGLAKGKQIITTPATVERMSPLLRATTRKIAALSVKGQGRRRRGLRSDLAATARTSPWRRRRAAQPVATAQLHLTHGAQQLVLEGRRTRPYRARCDLPDRACRPQGVARARAHRTPPRQILPRRSEHQRHLRHVRRGSRNRPAARRSNAPQPGPHHVRPQHGRVGDETVDFACVGR